MTKQKRQNQSRHLWTKNMDTETVVGTTLLTQNLPMGTAGAGNNLNCQNLAPRLNTISDAYAFYRITRLKFTLLPHVLSTASTILYGIAYSNSIQTINPANFVELAEMNCSIISTYGTSVNTHLEIPPKYLLDGEPKWYRTRPSAPDDVFEYQGRWYVLRGSTGIIDDFYLLVEYEMQFQGRLPTAITLVNLKSKMEDELRQEVLQRFVSPGSDGTGMAAPASRQLAARPQ